MDAQVETIEARLQSFLGQLQSEFGVLDRIIHKNKNQHRRSSYFQYLLKVRRDCKLLQSTNLLEVVNSCFLVINGNRPRQKVQLLESLKRRKSDGGKHNFLERLQGAARLLSQMVEPMLKAAMFHCFLGLDGSATLHMTCYIGATLSVLFFVLFGFFFTFFPFIFFTLHREISTLLARSFFMGFSMTVLALLARLRVLTQQILLDVVSVFNMASSISRKQQSIKLNQEGIEVYREYYPKNEETVFLECVWETDKFVLLEKKSEPENTNAEPINEHVICQPLSTVEYESIETIIGENEPADIRVDKLPDEDPASTRTDNLSSVEGLTNNCKLVEEDKGVKDQSGVLEPSNKNVDQVQITCSSLQDNQDLSKVKPKKVAFISVKKPEASKANDTWPLNKLSDDRVNGKKEDQVFSLLTEGI